MDKSTVVVVGGGFSGVAAAIAASKAGARTMLLERTDMLGGCGLRAGRVRYNGKIVLFEETREMGGGEIPEALESILLHKGNILDEEHVYVYNTLLLDTALLQLAEQAGVEVHLESRVVDVELRDGRLRSVVTEKGERYSGDVFVDASGGSGGLAQCIRNARACAMCIQRCPVFGDRVSIATKAGARELTYIRPGGVPGRLDPAVLLFKESLSSALQARLKKEGAFCIPIPEELIDYSRMDHFKGLRGPREVAHINLVDIGVAAKCVGLGLFSRDSLKKIPGFENVQYLHPMGAGHACAVAMLSITPRENTLSAKGLKNVFVAGEKAMLTGVDEVIVSGLLAGNNAARVALEREPVEIPRSTCFGDLIAYVGQMIETEEGRSAGYYTGHGVYLDRMKELGLYSTDPQVIRSRVAKAGLSGFFNRSLN